MVASVKHDVEYRRLYGKRQACFRKRVETGTKDGSMSQKGEERLTKFVCTLREAEPSHDYFSRTIPMFVLLTNALVP